MAKLGFGVLVVMQNEWPVAAADIQRYREIAASVGHTPRPPIILTNVSVAESRDRGPGARGDAISAASGTRSTPTTTSRTATWPR